jgi:hypothetical protein
MLREYIDEIIVRIIYGDIPLVGAVYAPICRQRRLRKKGRFGVGANRREPYPEYCAIR